MQRVVLRRRDRIDRSGDSRGIVQAVPIGRGVDRGLVLTSCASVATGRSVMLLRSRVPVGLAVPTVPGRNVMHQQHSEHEPDQQHPPAGA